MADNGNKAALVVGAGDALGGAIARRFAGAGYVACVARRDPHALASLVGQITGDGDQARAYGLDACDEEQVVATFDRIEKEVGPVEVAVFNAGSFSMGSILDLAAEQYRETWRLNAFGGFLVGREAARRMVPREQGTIIFTGATASLRGGANFAAFAGAKHALRALAQSMARELNSTGIHVGHVVIDGVIDTPNARKQFGDMIKDKPQPALLVPDDIAGVYLALHRQRRSAWTHEIDVRPWGERW